MHGLAAGRLCFSAFLLPEEGLLFERGLPIISSTDLLPAKDLISLFRPFPSIRISL
jgi:hypothetical protein